MTTENPDLHNDARDALIARIRSVLAGYFTDLPLPESDEALPDWCHLVGKHFTEMCKLTRITYGTLAQLDAQLRQAFPTPATDPA